MWGESSPQPTTHISRKDGIELSNHRKFRITETVTLTVWIDWISLTGLTAWMEFEHSLVKRTEILTLAVWTDWTWTPTDRKEWNLLNSWPQTDTWTLTGWRDWNLKTHYLQRLKFEHSLVEDTETWTLTGWRDCNLNTHWSKRMIFNNWFNTDTWTLTGWRDRESFETSRVEKSGKVEESRVALRGETMRKHKINGLENSKEKTVSLFMWWIT
jgi:hypothetical protein